MEPLNEEEDEEDQEMMDEETIKVIETGTKMGEMLKNIQQTYSLIVPSNLMISNQNNIPSEEKIDNKTFEQILRNCSDSAYQTLND